MTTQRNSNFYGTGGLSIVKQNKGSRMSIEDYGTCIATRVLNAYQDARDDLDYQLNDVYKTMIYLFKDDLEICECQEDIEGDLRLEIQLEIERYSFKISIEDVEQAIYKNFNIKKAE